MSVWQATQHTGGEGQVDGHRQRKGDKWGEENDLSKSQGKILFEFKFCRCYITISTFNKPYSTLCNLCYNLRGKVPPERIWKKQILPNLVWTY